MAHISALALGATVGTLILGALQAPDAEPPSSLDPGRATLTCSHDRKLVTACSMNEKKKCVADEAPADARTRAILRPVASHRVGAKDERTPVEIDLTDASGTPQKLEIAAGTWDVEWPQGGAVRARFAVAGGDELSMVLRTRNGACQRAKSECVLDAAHLSRSVEIPKKYRR